MKRAWIQQGVYGVLLGLSGWILLRVVDVQRAANPLARDYFLENGVEQTGAINLVTSIYLGFRTFDTLGETIVLFLAVSGTVLYLGRKG